MPDEFISCTHGKHNVIQRNNGIMPIPHKIRLKSPRCSLSSAKISKIKDNMKQRTYFYVHRTDKKNRMSSRQAIFKKQTT